MKAFLSHSSKDKYFVRQTAAALGIAQVEYDEQTFELSLNVEAIRRALKRSDLFVLFLSANSVSSSFVSEEQRAALEARGRGTIKRVLIFAIDTTSYKALPEWLREINVVQQLSSPKACARRLQSTLIKLDAEEYRGTEIYIGREEEEKALRRALSAPPNATPLSLHAVGYQGIGRRTFIRRTLMTVYPRQFDILEISLAQYQGIEEFFRSIYALHVVSSLWQTMADFDQFARQSDRDRIGTLSHMISEMASNGEFIVVVDDGGVYDEQGDYQPFLRDLIQSLAALQRPVLGFVQTRMMPLSRRQSYSRSYHTFLRPLGDDTVKELLGFALKERNVDFTAEKISAVAEHLDGHPFNIKFAVRFIVEYGIDSLIADPSELLEWKRRRAEDFLGRLEFRDIQVDIVAILADYRYVASDMLFALVDADPGDVARNLRRLEEFCCIERRESYYHISAPIREAVRRDSRFERSDDWKQFVARQICEVIKDYEDDDFISVPILETATVAAARGAEAPAFLSHLILPSHLLRIARDFYDRRRWAPCVEFCERAFEMKRRLPLDAQVEVLRLWGLSAIRMNDLERYNGIVKGLAGYGTQNANRIRLFLEGFNYRVRGDLDRAEEKYLEALRISPRNQSINRELASLYCKQRRYNDAESHARAAYEAAPTNPFIIDIMAETLLGKVQAGLQVDESELNAVLRDLAVYGDAPGSSFFLIRDAQQKARNRDYAGAMRSLDRAIGRTPALLTPYFIRAEVLLRMNDIVGAERDLQEINRLLTDAGGFSEGDEARAQELEISILIEKRQFRAAGERIERAAFLPSRVAQRLREQLARSIGFDPEAADSTMRRWAKDFNQQTPRRSRAKIR